MMVRLEVFLPWQSHKTRSYFNSMMVRLEAATGNSFITLTHSFQFHDGAIGRLSPLPGHGMGTLFQFHDGAIGR